MTEAWVVAAIVFSVCMIAPLFVAWVGASLLHGSGLPWRILLKRAEEDPYFNREYARPMPCRVCRAEHRDGDCAQADPDQQLRPPEPSK